MEPTRDARDTAPRSSGDDLLDDGLIAALSALVSQAGHAILEVARGPLGVTEKADHSPVTAADRAAQDVILSGLARLLPGLPVVSEESDANTGRDFGAAPFVLVDPLDGTREFIAGNGDYAVNIALVQGRRPVAGVVFVPRCGVLYRGRVGRGAERVALPAGAPDGAA
ncbi:3'(2'),5'-bisphosphate nucleotidase CysQ, partial [Rhodoplanes sp. SY1]|uniref:3'(2'),5'-bisphosphate nucleotidase CysQ family protein n=1 Tax=Rhodoplanes sp. SY1 TaxID=3166646 RepID=UPI0038B5C957